MGAPPDLQQIRDALAPPLPVDLINQVANSPAGLQRQAAAVLHYTRLTARLAPTELIRRLVKYRLARAASTRVAHAYLVGAATAAQMRKVTDLVLEAAAELFS